MKKLLVSLAIVCGMTSMVNAQETEKMWVSGNVGFGTNKVKGSDRTTNYRIVPEFGYQFAKDWGIGVQLGYNHDEYTIPGVEGKIKMDGFVVKPFARYTFLKNDFGGFFLDGGAGYTYGKNKHTDTKSHTFDIGIRPGVYMKVSNKISMTGKFGFLGYQYQKEGSMKVNSFGFDLDMTQVELGVNIHF